MPPRDPSILLVDDDVDICKNMADILSDLGYEVETAYDGPTALELLRRKPFHVALLDLRMPGMDGLTLYREIKKVRAGTAAMIVTAHANDRDTKEAMTLGVLKVLPKPIDLPKLMEHVEVALSRPLVLVVDDDHALCENLWDLLHEQGYRVCLAHGKAEAMGRLRDWGEAYRVVLIDLKLPDGNGGEVLQQVRAANPEAHVLVITGFRPEMDPEVEWIVAEEADAIFEKPFDVPALLSTVQQLA
jgi:DNA-binding NtrC family response regulator